MLQRERKLQQAEKRLCDSRRVVIEREGQLQEADGTIKDKENDLFEMQHKIDLANATLKNMEDDMRNQLAELGLQEKVNLPTNCLKCVHCSLPACFMFLLCYFRKLKL